MREDSDKQEHVKDSSETELTNSELLTYPLHFSDQQQEYMLCITRSDDRVQSFQQNIIKSIPTVLIIALILSIIGSRLFSYYMKKPIVRMSRIAERMAEQDFDWYCPDERDDEIGRLAKSLNKLSDELSAALGKLSDKNLYLKNEITLEKERETRRMLFFSGVSHELKTPISVVIGQIEGMRSGIGVYKDRDKYLEKCSNTLNELVSFINEILLVSHIDMGDMDSQETVKIDSILDEEIAFYDGLITEKNIELEYEVPDNVDFRGNEQLLKKALGNILGNAFKYTPEGGKVSVRLESQKEAENKSGKVNLTITNSPAHIDEQHLPHLFEAFYRADTSNKDGSGLGLYITGMVLEMFGAEYTIENTEDGVKFKVEQI
jgi:signal transduction histidine kinase